MSQKVVFTEDECDKIIAFSKTYEKHSSSEWWYGDNTKYDAWHLFRNQETEWIFKKLFDHIKNETEFIIVNEIDVVHLHNLKLGNKFELHIDKNSNFNVGACLNDDYDGGELTYYNPEYSLPKIKGEIYTFYGNREHEVKTVTRGERWSLIGFFKKGTIKNKNIKLI